MQFYEILLTGVGLSADAFAVAVCIGLARGRGGAVAACGGGETVFDGTETRSALVPSAVTAGLYFGVFQGAMPLAGFYLFSLISSSFSRVGGYAAAFVLAIIGAKMLLDSRKPDGERPPPSLAPRRMIPLAVATSIDALAVGASFVLLEVDIFFAAPIIGLTTLVLAGSGVFVGRAAGDKLKNKSEIFGGIILIVIGVKILIENIYMR